MNRLLSTLGILLFVLTGSLLNAQTGWVEQINPLGVGDTAMIGKVEFVSPTEGWISGSRGDFLHTTDGGSNWLAITPFPDDTIWSPSDAALSMSWVNTTHGWKINSIGQAYGISYGVVIHQTTDGGNTWQKKALSSTEGDFAVMIQFVDINTGWLLYFNFSTQVATFLKTTDGGNNWNPFMGAGIFFFVDANNGWSFYGPGQNGSEPPYQILRTTNGGTNWAYQYTDNNVGGYNAMYFSDVNNGWIVGDAGKVLKTTDGGTNWNIVTNSGINSNERSKTVFFLDANNGWISSEDNSQNPYIQHTTDGGISWQTQTTPLGNPNGYNAVFSIFFYDAQHGWLTGDYGNICHYSGTTGVEENNNIPIEFTLSQNYPNPFNPSTVIRYQLPVASQVSLKVFNVLGNEVATLVNDYKSAGSYDIDFNSTNLSSGVYFYQLKVGSLIQTRKMLLLK